MILVYHHNDLDGICAAAIIIKRYGAENVKCVPVQYEKNTWNPEDVKNASSVWVVDFTFSDMEALAELAGDKLVWCDHHKSAQEQHKELWGSDIKGLRNMEYAGCGLTWTYCYPDTETPSSVLYIEDRDLWRFIFPNTKPFCAGAAIDTPFHEEWDQLLKQGVPEIMIEYISRGNASLKSQERRVKYLFELGTDAEIHGHKARIVNSTSDVSELGEYIYTNGYEIAVMWHCEGDKIKCDLRSNVIDCAEIAQQYGGGGHKGAAGFRLDNSEGFPMELF